MTKSQISKHQKKQYSKSTRYSYRLMTQNVSITSHSRHWMSILSLSLRNHMCFKDLRINKKIFIYLFFPLGSLLFKNVYTFNNVKFQSMLFERVQRQSEPPDAFFVHWSVIFFLLFNRRALDNFCSLRSVNDCHMNHSSIRASVALYIA